MLPASILAPIISLNPDYPISQRHLRITYSSMRYSDKTFMGMTTSPKTLKHADVRHPLWLGFIDDHPVVTGNCNGNSPFVG